MMITKNMKVGELAAQYPAATRVFDRHGIDFCCGGSLPLDKVCQSRGLDTEGIVGEILKELETRDENEESWNEAPLDELIEHILAAYHLPLSVELPRLESMARKVEEVHGEKDPERFKELLTIYLWLRNELEQHMEKEEQILFPLIGQGQGFMAEGPISVMEYEHQSVGSVLKRIRELTDNYEAPEKACNTWRALWDGLAELEDSLHKHIHLENNILFPRALAG